MQVDVVLEMIPELPDVLGPERSQQGLFLEDGITGIGTSRQLCHEETFCIALVATQYVAIVEHVGDGLPFGILGNQFRMPQEGFGLLGPVTVEQGLLQ